MYEIIDGNSHGLKDVDGFIRSIDRRHVGSARLFDRRCDLFITRAPGRLDVMGGIADYSGSLVMPMPIAEATLAALQLSDDRDILIHSLHSHSDRFSKFKMSLDDIDSLPELDYYETAKQRFVKGQANRWAGYAAGVYYVLKRELRIDFTKGARILISSDIPVSKGVSSSAAIEVAVMQAVCAAHDIDIEHRQLALLCQKVENRIVGAACGVMDQVAVTCGVENSLVSLLCQPADIGEPVAVPDEIELWGVDSGVRHSVAGSDYSSVRRGAFMGYRIIADAAGLEVERLGNGRVSVKDERWQGYLANISPDEYEREFSGFVPEIVLGSDFLGRYGGTTDPVTSIDPTRTYAVKAPTKHAVYESARVKRFSELLEGKLNADTLREIGDLLFESHASYKACGLTEERTDRLVEMARRRRGRGILGARITGGGSGGTVLIVTTSGCRDEIQELVESFGRETGQKHYVFHGSSMGSAAFRHIRVTFT